MAVAKSYAKSKINGEPFKEKGRMYVNIETPSGLKKVRWYTDEEYSKMYPGEMPVKNIMNFNARHVFGFGPEGFITIYKGNKVEEWAEKDRTNIRFNLTFLYYTPSRLELPKLEEGIEAIRINWEEVMDHDNFMKAHEQVQKIIAAKLGTLSNSEFQGNVGEWLEKTLVIKENTTREDRFGEKHTHKMMDEAGNIYMWETGAKNFAVDSQINLRMKVKEHKEINGDKVTVVWYCKEI